MAITPARVRVARKGTSVTEQELVQAYLEGQVSRRTFIRRLVATGISLAAAITYAHQLWGEAARAGSPGDFYTPGEPAPADAEIQVTSSFTPTPLVVFHGAAVRWRFHEQHSVRNDLGFLASGFKPYYDPDLYGDTYTDPSDTYTRRFPASGTFDYFCEHPSNVHPPMVGQVVVPMFREPKKDQVGERFRIFWASAPAPGGFGFDVQIRRPGDGGGNRRAPGKWDDWKANIDKPSARFRPRQPGRYRFRARLRNDAGAVSGWSPPISIRATD